MPSLKHVPLIICIALLMFFAPYAYAQEPTCTDRIGDVCVLEPSLFQAADSGGVSDLSGYLKAIFRIGVGVAAALAVIQIVIGGFKYMTQDIPGVKQDARQQIADAVLGLILVGASYLILQQINPKILDFNLIQTLREATERAEEIGTEAPGVSDLTTENNARAQLTNTCLATNGCLGVKPVYGPCGTSPCTNISGLPESTMQRLARLSDDCNCAIEITGGTETVGHGDTTEHGPGRPVVDLRPTGALNASIWGNPSNPPHNYKVGPYTFEQDNQGESSGNHWHVNFGG